MSTRDRIEAMSGDCDASWREAALILAAAIDALADARDKPGAETVHLCQRCGKPVRGSDVYVHPGPDDSVWSHWECINNPQPAPPDPAMKYAEKLFTLTDGYDPKRLKVRQEDGPTGQQLGPESGQYLQYARDQAAAVIREAQQEARKAAWEEVAVWYLRHVFRGDISADIRNHARTLFPAVAQPKEVRGE